MPYTIEVDHDTRRIAVTATDPVGLSDALALLDRQVAEGAWSYGTVHDARSITWLATEEDVRTIVAYVDYNSRALGPRGPVGFVAAPEALFGMARMYSQIATGSMLNARVFQDTASAMRWLESHSQARSDL